VLQCVAVCCSVLQCVAVCCSVLQCVAVCCSVLQCVAVCCGVVCCSVTDFISHICYDAERVSFDRIPLCIHMCVVRVCVRVKVSTIWCENA